MSRDVLVTVDGGDHRLINPYDPSLGFVDDLEGDEGPVHDPWEEAAEGIDAGQAEVLDVDALRRRG